jgi:NarL family two-component system response regulator LiaR
MTDVRLTCVIADDHPAVVASLAAFLPRSGIQVVDQARAGEEALRKIEECKPDIALLDLRMPGLDGSEVIRRARHVSPETAAVVYTGYADSSIVDEVLDAGARGVVLKDAPLPDLVRALELVSCGGIYIDAGLTAALAVRRSATPQVTQREREILRLLSDGFTNEEIGKQLFISPETVRTHVRRVIAKLGAKTRTQAVASALRRQLIA